MTVENEDFFADAMPDAHALVLAELRGEVARLTEQLLEERAVRERQLDLLRQDLAALRQNMKTTLKVAISARGAQGWSHSDMDAAVGRGQHDDPSGAFIAQYPELDF